MTRTAGGPLVVVDPSKVCRDVRPPTAGAKADETLLDRFSAFAWSGSTGSLNPIGMLRAEGVQFDETGRDGSPIAWPPRVRLQPGLFVTVPARALTSRDVSPPLMTVRL